MKMFRKITVIFLIALMLLSLSACSKSAEKKEPEQSDITEVASEAGLDGTIWIAATFQSAGSSEALSVYETDNGIIASFDNGTITLIDVDGVQLNGVKYSCSDGKIIFDGYAETEMYGELNGDSLQLTSPSGTVFNMKSADADEADKYRVWMSGGTDDLDEPYSQTDSADGYVLYENELFSTEVPEDWDIQKTKIQFFYDTILEPHEGLDRWCGIIINGGGFNDGDVEKLHDDYINTGIDINFYEMTIGGQTAQVIERGGGSIGLSMRDIYASAPNGSRFTLHFNCPNGGKDFDFSAIDEIMNHFIDNLEFR